VGQIDLLAPGELPPVGVVPRRMHATTLRRERYGEPLQAFQDEVVPVPRPGPGEVLVAVMAAGLNFNAIWAARGHPVDVIALRQARGEVEPFHVPGSDAAGIVWACGEGVTDVAVGDEVVVAPGRWDPQDAWIRRGGDLMRTTSLKAWGFETTWGSFAQYCLVQVEQLTARPPHLSWAESAVFSLCGVTAVRMLHHWQPNVVRPGEVVLVWGGAGGLGVYGIQVARAAGALPIAIVSGPERAAACRALGAIGTIDRGDFAHWGPLPEDINEPAGLRRWLKAASAFGRAIWEIGGEGVQPGIVFEHPGQQTMPTSIFVCRPGGMVVTCAGTSGYLGSYDLRFLWMKEKRLQGSHGGGPFEAELLDALVRQRKVGPALGWVGDYEDIGALHAALAEGRAAPGKTAVLIGARGSEPTGPHDLRAGLGPA